MEKEPLGTPDAWVETVGPGYKEVAVEREFKGKSAPNMCSASIDEGRHHWFLVAVGSQSAETLECGFCEEKLYD